MNMMGEPPPYRWPDLHEQVATTTTMTELHGLPLFAELYTPQPETQEIIVEPQTVQSLLGQILELQSPERRDIQCAGSKRGLRGAGRKGARLETQSAWRGFDPPSEKVRAGN